MICDVESDDLNDRSINFEEEKSILHDVNVIKPTICRMSSSKSIYTLKLRNPI